MTNTLFVEQISCQINFVAGNIWQRFFFLEETFDHVPGNKKIKFHRYADLGRTQETLACSQTLYFLFTGCRACMMKYKPHAHSRTLALLASSPMFSKRTKRKIKQCLCTGYRDFRHRRTLILKVYINGHENGRKSRKGTQ